MEAISTGDIGGWAPWYTAFRHHWANETRASEHESFLHPVACVLAVSGSEPDPVGSLRELQRHAVVGKVQTASFTGPNMLFYYVLVHDERDTAILQTVDATFDQVRRAFGQNCTLLRANSNTYLLGTDSNDRDRVSGVWSSYYDHPHRRRSGPQSLDPVPVDRAFGTMMTMRDVAALRDAVKQMMVRSVVPHMQYMVRVLSDKTANQRRGITGRLFSAGRRYFGATTKTSSTARGVDGDVYFAYDSAEAMLRKLADYSFMLKDYKFAQSVYQVARRDFQSEKAWKCYAGAQEMVGISKLMMEIHASKAEFDSNFEDAISMYLYKTQTQQPFLAVRCIILYYELLKHHRLYSFAPDALLRVPGSVASLFALMNEQAALAYLKFSPRPEMRRFSFYAMVAAQAYQGAGLRELSYRCLRAVHTTLGASIREAGRGTGDTGEQDPWGGEHNERKADGYAALCSRWTSIDSHINHELGRQCMGAQRYDEAFMHFMALMGNDKVPPKLQAKYLQELLQLFLESSEAAEKTGDRLSAPRPVELSVPAIDPRQARIIMSPDLEGEDALLAWTRSGAAPAQPDVSPDDSLGGRCCSVGESVAVLLVVSNPLTIGVTLSSFTLECRFDPASESEEEEEGSGGSPAAQYEVSTVDSVVLEGGQVSMVTVQITPHCAGSLSIVGAKYLLCDILPTRKPLRLPGRRLNDTKEQRLTATYAPATTLGFRIDPGFPHLQMTLLGFPDTLMSGSMCQASAVVRNCGTRPCRSMALWLSHPSFFDIKSPQQQSEAEGGGGGGGAGGAGEGVYTYTAAGETVASVERLRVPNVLSNPSTFALVGEEPQDRSDAKPEGEGGGLHHITPIRQLDPGASCVVPLWLRGDRVGAHALKICIGASTELETLCTAGAGGGGRGRGARAGDAAASCTTMRTRSFEVDLVVTPSLRVNAFVRPSSTNPHERILGVDVENMRPDLHVELVQTTFSSGCFRLTPVSAEQPPPEGPVRIGPRQTISLVYRAQPFILPPDSRQLLPEMFTIRALRQYVYSGEERRPTALPPPIDLVYSTRVFGDGGRGAIDCIHSSLQGFIMRAQANKRRSMLRANFPLIAEQHFPTLFPLFETFGVDFVLFWREAAAKEEPGGVRGHHSITGIDLGIPSDYATEALNPPAEGAARTWLADTAQERQALVASIASRPSTATAHSRAERPLDVAMAAAEAAPAPAAAPGDGGGSGAARLFVVDVAVSVYNHSWRHAYAFTLDLVSPGELEDGAAVSGGGRRRLEMAGSRAAWWWIGATSHSTTVAPHGVATVSARLACSAPGVIDVALWRLAAKAVEPRDTRAGGTQRYRSRSCECELHPHQPCFVVVGAEPSG